MKKLFLVSALFLFSLSLYSQEVDTLYNAGTSSVLSIGASGGISFIRPEQLNDKIDFVNTSVKADMRSIQSSVQWSGWIMFRPKNLPNYGSLRIEYLNVSRSYSTPVYGRNDTGGITQNFLFESSTTYSVYPFSINTGFVYPKLGVRFEIGFIYALATITEKVSIDNSNSSTNASDGNGYGMRASLQQLIPLSQNIGLTADISYRYLNLQDFLNSRGSTMKDFEMNFSGPSGQLGLEYRF